MTGHAQLRIGRRAAVAGIALYPIARHCGDNAVGSHLADDVVTHNRNEQVAQGVHSQAIGPGQFRTGRRAAVTQVASCPVASHRGDDPVGSHPADALVSFIRNEQVAGGVHSHSKGPGQFRTGRRAAIAGVALCPVARHRFDNPVAKIRAVQLPLIGKRPCAGDGHRKRGGAASQHDLVGRLRQDYRDLGFSHGDEGAKQYSGPKQRNC